jgi:hypothetical protein
MNKIIKKLLKFLIVLTMSFTLSSSALADMDPKVKALGTMAAYGTIGGALLGTATLAFGSGGRSIAKGASLGLYAGLVFGTFVVVTHAMKRRSYRQSQEEDYYPDTQNSPYEREGESQDSNGDNSGGFGLFNRVQSHEEMRREAMSEDRFRGQDVQKIKNRPVYYLNLVHYEF